MNRLLEIGFQYAGNWLLTDDIISYTLKHHEYDKNVLYAFICNGVVMYIGKTTMPLTKRMYGYQNPGSSQPTNKKNNGNIRHLLNNGEPVDIFVFASNGLLKYGDYNINLAAGLEDPLIDKINPPWNGNQNKLYQYTAPPVPSNTGTPTTNNTFQLQLGIAYYNQGFINVPIKFTEILGKDGEKIEIYLAGEPNPILGYINRTATSNQTPRIIGGKILKSWIQENCKQEQYVRVDLLGKHQLQIEPI
jgi:hypothetical protein